MCLYRGDRSAPACSPTKIAEYLIAGLPVVASTGMGDVDRILLGQLTGEPTARDCEPVGVLIDERDPRDLERAADELMRLLEDPATRTRCRAVAERCFDLEKIGWKRYQRIYGRLIGVSQSGSAGSLPGSELGPSDRSLVKKPIPAHIDSSSL